MKNIIGKAFIFGDNIDTDVIIPARYLNMTDSRELAVHCMEDIDKDFASVVSEGDVIVAGKNFGCGSSREHAPAAIKASGISLVVAESFSRIFYRNALNIGLPIAECRFVGKISQGDLIFADLEKGIVTDETTGETREFSPFPDFLRGIIECGGLLESVAAKKSFGEE